MNVIEHLTAQHRLSDVWGDIIDANTAYSRSADPDERNQIAARIADLHDQAAELLDSSGLVRWLSSSLDADQLRERGQHWRLYGDPEDDNHT